MNDKTNVTEPLPAAPCSDCGVLVRRIIIAALLAAVWKYPWFQWLNFAVLLAILHYAPRRRTPN